MQLKIPSEQRQTWPVGPATASEALAVQALEMSAIDVDDFARVAVAVYETQADRNRRMFTRRRRAIAEDNWTSVLKESMRDWLSAEVLAQVCGKSGKLVDVSRNPFKHITSELAQLYLTSPERTTEDQRSAVAYERLMQGTRFHEFWQQVDLLAEQFNDVLIWPSVAMVGDTATLVHRYVAGDQYTVIVSEDDPTKPEAVILKDEFTALDGSENVRYIVWSDEWHFVADCDGKAMPAPGAEGFENPFGFMPHVHVHLTPSCDRYWDTTTGEDLVSLTLSTGRLRTLSNYSWKMSSFKQPVISGEGADRVSTRQGKGEETAMRFPGDVSVTIADFQFDSDKRIAYQESDALAAAASRGINPERFKRSGSYQTGTAAKSADRGLIERRAKKTGVFQQAEREYFANAVRIADIAGVNRQLTGAIDETQLLDVNHSELDYPTDPIKRNELFKERVSLGLESLVGDMRRCNPTLSEEEAKAQIIANIELNAEIADIKVRRNVPDDLSNNSRAAEVQGRQGPAVRDSNPDS